MKASPFLCLLLSSLTSLLPASAQDSPALTPASPVNLLSDPEFKEFTWHLNPKQSLTEKREEVWIIKDGQLYVTGKGFGYLRTQARYRDYHLVLDYQWGEHTWGPRLDRARDCGLLLHAFGEDGAFADTWMNSIEAQLIEGGSGDILVLAYQDKAGVKAPTRLFAEVKPDRDSEPVWTPGGERLAFPPQDKTAARINWRGRDPDWADVRGYRGAKDIENPLGEWNRMEVICRGDTIRILLNGELVNEGSGANPSEGFICLQSEAAACLIRRFELWPLDHFNETWAPEAGSTDTGYSPDGKSLLPRRLPLTPEQSQAAWEVDGTGYEVQLAAAEPLVGSPVDVVWDARGRMYVAEMGDYPLPPTHGPLLSRIRVLFDKNGDGQIDESRVFASELDHCQGLCPLRDGLLVTTRTAILFLRDTDGDHVADETTVLFESNEPRHNQLQISSPRWGLDNAIYFCNGLDGKEIYPPNPQAGQKVEMARTNLRYDPRTGEITPVTGYGQFGGTFDDWGHHFSSSNRNPAMFSVMPLEAVKRNAKSGVTQGYEDIQPQAAPVWPIALSHTTSVAHAGTHTAACGLAVYRGGLVPDLTGSLFVCEPTAQLVTRNQLEPQGASFLARRVGEKRDFLASADEWTRPVNLRDGPDGALYICDMYRRFIDHAIFFPEAFVNSHYMRAGFDQGRIWRLVPKGFKPRRIEPLPESPESLVPLLEHPDAWRRIHAQRLIVEAQATGAAPAIAKLLAESKSPLGRLHALWTLDGLGQLAPEQIRTALGDAHSGVLESAIHLADSGRDRDLLAGMARSRTDRVAFLALLALVPDPADDVTEICRHLLTKTPALEDPWMRRAMLTGSPRRLDALLVALLESHAAGEVPPAAADAAIGEFAESLGAQGEASQIASVLDSLAKHRSRLGGAPFILARSLGSGLIRGNLKTKSLVNLIETPPAEIGDRVSVLRTLTDEAIDAASDKQRPAAERIAALPLAAQRGLHALLPLAEKLIVADEPAELQEAVCKALAPFDRQKIAEFFFSRWKTLPPAARREALTLLSANTTTAKQLMLKMKAGEISPALMDPMQRWVFSRSKDEEIKNLAQELFGQASGDRGKVIEDYQNAMADKPGDPEKGRAVFAKAACITCHKLGGSGVDVGPSLLDVRAKPREALLSDILDPNRAVEERWTGYAVELKDGRSLAGLIAGETPDSIVVRLPGGHSETVPRAQLASFTTTGVSLMPVGLEAAITPEEMADLLAFLKQR